MPQRNFCVVNRRHFAADKIILRMGSLKAADAGQKLGL
jgi:hypothetical protein